jgi:hypothetical protein
MTPRRPIAPAHPDFGASVWNGPSRNVPFTLRFFVVAVFDFGRFRRTRYA